MTLKERLPKEQEELKSLKLSKTIWRQVSVKAHLFLFMVVLGGSLRAQSTEDFPWSEVAIAAHHHLTQYRLAEADSLFQILPASPEKAYLLSLRDFMEMIYSDSEALYTTYLKNSGERKKWFDHLKEDDPWKIFYLADLRLQGALLRIRFGDYFSGLYELWQANRLLSTHSNDEKNAFLPLNKTQGVINLLLGLAPENYKWALSMMGLKGSADLGILQLDLLAGSNTSLAHEARLILGYYYLYPLNQPATAATYFSAALNSDAPGQTANLLAHLMLATSYSKNHEGARALALMQAVPQGSWDDLPAGFYLLGDLHLQKGDWANSRASYQRFLDKWEGKNFIKDASVKIAISHQLQGNDDLTAEWKQKCLALPDSPAEPDKNAAAMLSELNDYPQPLLIARFASDGGYYDGAMQQLKIFHPNGNPRWTCEYHYRKARVYHLQNKLDEALSGYVKAVAISEGTNWYIGANSALLAGHILRQLQNEKEAAFYYKKALEYPEHSYKRSIDQQAARALALPGSK